MHLKTKKHITNTILEVTQANDRFELITDFFFFFFFFFFNEYFIYNKGTTLIQLTNNK